MTKYYIYLFCLAGSFLFWGCAVTTPPMTSPPKQATVKTPVKAPSPAPRPVRKPKKKPTATVRPPAKVHTPPAPKKIPVKKIIPPPRNLSLVKMPDAGDSRFLSAVNFVTRWQVYGPFKISTFMKKISAPSQLIHCSFVNDEKHIDSASHNFKGQFLTPGHTAAVNHPGMINLAVLYPRIHNAAAYAVAELQCSRPLKKLKLYCGSGGYIKIWLNDKLIHAYSRHDRVGNWDQDMIPDLNLHRGRNKLVVKLITMHHPWIFYLRFTDSNGLPLSFMPPPKKNKE